MNSDIKEVDILSKLNELVKNELALARGKFLQNEPSRVVIAIDAKNSEQFEIFKENASHITAVVEEVYGKKAKLMISFCENHGGECTANCKSYPEEINPLNPTNLIAHILPAQIVS